MYVYCIFILWSLCCLFFYLRILITPLVSSNSSNQVFEQNHFNKANDYPHFKPLNTNTEMNTTTYAVRKACLVFGQSNKCGGDKPVPYILWLKYVLYISINNLDEFVFDGNVPYHILQIHTDMDVNSPVPVSKAMHTISYIYYMTYWCRRGRDRMCSWIYNYLCNQSLSPLKLWVLTPFMTRLTRYTIM